MTKNESSNLLAMLSSMQDNVEKITKDEQPQITIVLPNTLVKHTLKGHLAVSVCKSLARTFENERMYIMTLNKNR